MANKAEIAAAKEKLCTVYRITKQQSGRKNINININNLLTSEREQVKRWAQHFEEVLNGREAEEPAKQYNLRTDQALQ